MKKIKLAFILPNLLTGGTQRVMLNIANHLNKEKFKVYLIVINREDLNYNKHFSGADKISDLENELVVYIKLQCSGVKYSILKIRNVLKTINPDIVFSSLSYVNLYLAIFKPILPKAKYIARESNLLSIKHKTLKVSTFHNSLYRIFYKNFDGIVCQSEDMRNDLFEKFHVYKTKLKVIHNPVDITQIKLKSSEDYNFNNSVFNLITVGHITIQKGHDLLLDAIKKIKDDSIVLHIVGRFGNNKSKLDKIIRNHPFLEMRLKFHGFQSNPYKMLAKADAFVLSSRFEGFPNALLEAGSLGLPLIAFDNPGGMSEIISSDTLGQLAIGNDSSDLAEKIINVKNTSYNKQAIKNHFQKNFGMEKIIIEYENFFIQMLD